jgi:hypothetical protein
VVGADWPTKATKRPSGPGTTAIASQEPSLYRDGCSAPVASST